MKQLSNPSQILQLITTFFKKSELQNFGMSSKTEQSILDCIRNNKTILVSGGAGTGKTTLVNILVKSIHRKEKLTSIEDVQEIDLSNHPYHEELIYPSGSIYSTSDKLSGITPNSLVQNALVDKPDWLLFGEVQKIDAGSFLNAITSRESIIGSINATTPQQAINRLIDKITINSTHLDTKQLESKIYNSLYGIIQITHNPKNNKRIVYFEKVKSLSN